MMDELSAHNSSANCSSESCLNCKQRELSLLDDLSPEDLSFIELGRSSSIYKAGDVIFQEGEVSQGLLCLHTGKVKITKSGLLETPQVTALKKPVDFLGLKALILEQDYDSTATALEDSTVCLLKKSNFLQVLKANVNLSMKVMRLLALEISSSENRMLSLTQKHMRGRLADALLLLLDEYGTTSDQITLDVQLKRADLAAMANMTVANAIRILSAFSKENLIAIKRREIEITSLDGLKKVSQLG